MLKDWLESVGLAHLPEKLQAHGLDEADLADLTDSDLAELGLTIGERKRFRRALAERRTALVSGQRRPLTMAFFDLVESSRLYEELDAEDVIELLQRYRASSCDAIERWGGHVAHLVGDGILAYFGYPTARENDAERAVRAALEIAAAVPRLDARVDRPLAVRSGIATGRVILCELVSDRAADKHSATGSTANLAARLQTLAQPNDVVVSAATRHRVDHLFDCEDLGDRSLKGFSTPMRAFRVRGVHAQPRLREEGVGAALTPFVGRQAELAKLRSLWREVERGVGGAVLIHGEPGVGKSRLVARFLAETGGADSAVARLHASELDAHSPLRTVMAYVRGRLNGADVSAGIDDAGALRTLLSDVSDDGVEAVRAFLAADIDVSDGRPGAAGELRHRTLDALAAHFAAAARSGPFRLVVEDAHWLDMSSKELLARVIAMAGRHQLLVLITSRLALADVLPEVAASDVHELPLEPFGPQEVQAMVRACFGDEPVPREIARRIAERTDGVPLFVEELLRPLLDRASVASWAALAMEHDQPTAVPATLHEALTARLDALGAEREVAQVAAVLGRTIYPETLAAVLGQPQAAVAKRLDALCTAGVLRREEPLNCSDGPPRFVFSHVLVRDAAYDTLLRDDRRRLHEAAADTLIERVPQFAADRPDIIAWHLTEGGRPAASLPYWLAAGRRAAVRSSLHEARHVLERGLRIAEDVPTSRETVEVRLEFASLLGPVLFALCGPRSVESRAIYGAAAALAETSPESLRDFAVLWGWWRLPRDFRVKGARAQMLMRLARRRGAPEMLLQAHHCNWARTFHEGDLAACRCHIAEGLAVYARSDCPHRPWLFGNHDAKVCALGELAQVMWLQGELRSAIRKEREAIDWAERQAHVGSEAHALDMAMLHRFYRRDVTGTRAHAQRVIALAEDCGMAEYRARGRLFLGWAVAQSGDAAAGHDLFVDAYRRQRAIGTDEDTPVYAAMCAEILNRLGEHDRAERELEEMTADLDRLGIANWRPELWRLLGVTRLKVAPTDRERALSALATAATIAAQQRVTMLELRIAVSRAELVDVDETDGALARLEFLRARVAEADRSLDLMRVDACLRHRRERRVPPPRAAFLHPAR